MSGASGWRDDPAHVYSELPRTGFRTIRRGWALVRWIALVVGVGVGAAAAIAIGVAALVTLLEESV
jgi:hypothetical protein